MSMVIIGKDGQLASEIMATSESEIPSFGPGDIDIFDEQNIFDVLSKYNPTSIINAAAYTAVDRAETEKEAAYKLNALAVKNLASYCKKTDCFMVHVSTDYVFNGINGTPYLPDDKIDPQGAYGETKAQGEKYLLEILGEHSTIIRTSWVYSAFGNNFVKTMLKLMAEKPMLKVIDDQIGSPTWAKALANACIEASNERISGIYHWTDEGVASWYDFAVTIQKIGVEKGILSKKIPILPIPTSDYPTPARRPNYSVLDKVSTRKTFSTNMTHWYQNLSNMIDEMIANN